MKASKMRLGLKNEWQQTVSPKQFYLSVLGVAVLLCGVGVYTVQFGSNTGLRHGTLHALIAFIVLGNLVAFMRFGKRALPWRQVAFSCGSICLIGSDLFPHTSAAYTWTNTIGVVTQLVWLFFFLFTLKKPRSTAPPTS